MKLKTRARYALRSMIEIARSSATGRPLSLEKIARRTGISRRYLEHLVGSLRDATLVKSVRGRHGGYHLARPADEVLLGHVVEAVIGPISIVDCIHRPEMCLVSSVCECRDVYRVINDKVIQALNSYSLADLVDQAKPPPSLSSLAELDLAAPTQSDMCQSLCSSR